MKNYLLTDFAVGLFLLATICIGGFTWMEYRTKQIEQALKEKPIEIVRKEMLANNATQAEKTMFERASRDISRFEVVSKVTE